MAARLARRQFVSAAAYRLAKRMMPKISATERVALGCGSVGFDREIFSGKPNLKKLIATYSPKFGLSAEEDEFLSKETEELCLMCKEHQVYRDKDFTPEVWESNHTRYVRKRGFFGLKIPKEWGGKGFSTAATSAILVKLSSVSADLSSTVAVPNSLGPGELLVRYGTPVQNRRYLPLLADGTLIPCFGLTGIHSGSDATSLIGSFGVVEKHPVTGALGVRCEFDKRYITLAPVAGLVGIGFELRDPNGLLKGSGSEGFSVALLERGHENLEMGPRHEPLAAAFMNGTVKGKDVWVSMDQILGGQERCGYGWHMFVECLAEGRGVSLPATAVALAKGLGPAVGAYSRARKQFKVPIAEFGGVQEALAAINSDGYVSIASTELMNAIVDNHEAPMVISSIMKQNVTDRARTMVIAGMDIMGGAAISMGDRNILGQAWMTMPIAITVEGANIMTRSFQIIGQGLMRCHPHLRDVVDSLEADASDAEAPKRFMAGVGQMVGHAFSTFGRSVYCGVRDALPFSATPGKTHVDRTVYERDAFVRTHDAALSRLAANFAFAADLGLLLGGRLKFEEMFMGRLADSLGAIFLGYTILVHYERNAGHCENKAELQRIAHHALLRLEKEAQEALIHASRNLPAMPLGSNYLLGAVLRIAAKPLGALGAYDAEPSDSLTKQVAELTTLDSEYARKFLRPGVCTAQGTMAAKLLAALPLCVQADKLAATLRKANRPPTPEETKVLQAAVAARDDIVQVDAFSGLGKELKDPAYQRPALVQTAKWLKEIDLANTARPKVAAAA